MDPCTYLSLFGETQDPGRGRVAIPKPLIDSLDIFDTSIWCLLAQTPSLGSFMSMALGNQGFPFHVD